MSRKSAKQAVKVVRRQLADGTEKVYRYTVSRTKARLRGDTVGDLIAAWEHAPEWRDLSPKTQHLYALYLRPLSEIVGHIVAANVDRRAIIDIRNAIAEHRGNGAATQFVKVSTKLFNWAIDNARLKESPAARVKRLKGGELPAWTEHDAALALRYLPEHLRRAVVLALYTGQRRGDLVALPWSAYDGQRIRLIQQKRTKAPPVNMVIPCHNELRTELDAWRQGPLAGIAKATVLVNAKGKPWAANNLTTQLGTALDAIGGFPAGRNIHGLRKLAATNLAHAGCSMHEIASITGHKTLAMVQLYTASADQERLAEAAVFRLSENAENGQKT